MIPSSSHASRTVSNTSTAWWPIVAAANISGKLSAVKIAAMPAVARPNTRVRHPIDQQAGRGAEDRLQRGERKVTVTDDRIDGADEPHISQQQQRNRSVNDAADPFAAARSTTPARRRRGRPRRRRGTCIAHDSRDIQQAQPQGGDEHRGEEGAFVSRDRANRGGGAVQ